MKWREYVVYGGLALLVVGVVAGMFYGLAHAASTVHDQQKRDTACRRVLDCLDLDVGRTKCDELFPGCSLKDEEEAPES